MTDNYRGQSPSKWKFNLPDFVTGLIQGAANTQGGGGLLTGAFQGAAESMDYFNRNNFRQAYINNLIQDNLRAQNYYNLEKDHFDWQKQKYNEGKYLNPEDARYEREMRRLKLAQEKNKTVASRKELSGEPKRRDWFTSLGTTTNPDTNQLEGISYNAATNEYSRKPIPVYGTEIQPKVKPTIPAGDVTKFSDFKTLLDDTKSLVGSYDSSYSGPIQGRIARFKENWTGGLPEKQLGFNQILESLKNRLIYLRSGAQINENEFKRLMNELPDIKQPDDTIRARLSGFQNLAEELYNNRISGMGAAGYRNTEKLQQLGGTHTMPDGSTMSNSEMKTTTPQMQQTQPQSVQQKIEATKNIGGKTYIKINGQWFEQ